MSSEWTDEAVRDTLANLSEPARSMLAALEEKSRAWEDATDRQRHLAVEYGVPIEVAIRVDEQMTAAMVRELDHATFHGVPKAPEPTPGEVHARLLGTDGATTPTQIMRGEGLIRTDPPHSGEQPTPEQRRAAWLRVHRSLVKEAEEQLRRARLTLPHLNASDLIQWALADEWAALQLLKHLRDMKAPDVPEDPEPGQATIQDALEGEEGDGRRVHFIHTDGTWVHPGHGSSRPPLTTEHPEQVTCKRCRNIMGWERG